MSEDTNKAMIKAVYKVLRPLVRLLMRYGVTYRTFADVARHIYVDVAEQDFALEKRKPSNSRTAILTGINRKDIAKLKNRAHPLEFSATESVSCMSKVVTAWLNDKRAQNNDGSAKVLEIESNQQDSFSFTDLVNEYTTDITLRALLDELTRTNTCEVSQGKVKLKVNAYIPIEDMNETLRIFGTAASDLLGTMDHNIARLKPGPFLQRTVSYNRIPSEQLNSVRLRCTQEGDEFLLKINEWLALQDMDQNKELTGSGRHRAGIGIYYIEHAEQDNNNEEPHE